MVAEDGGDCEHIVHISYPKDTSPNRGRKAIAHFQVTDPVDQELSFFPDLIAGTTPIVQEAQTLAFFVEDEIAITDWLSVRPGIRYTDYEVRMKVRLSLTLDWPLSTSKFQFQTNLPVFRVKESSVRRRYSDFEWLRNELERDSKVRLNF